VSVKDPFDFEVIRSKVKVKMTLSVKYSFAQAEKEKKLGFRHCPEGQEKTPSDFNGHWVKGCGDSDTWCKILVSSKT
jgi:hypothetical protein